MIPYKTSIPSPDGDEDFEELCLIVYRETYRDFSAVRVGRSGQAQGGVDILARDGTRRVGIQCKRVKYGKLTEAVINKEIEKADTASVRIDEMIVATTAPSSAALVQFATRVTDTRQAMGKFGLTIHFWDSIEALILASPKLQNQFAPVQPGGMMYELREGNATIQRDNEAISQQLAQLTAMVAAQQRAVSGQVAEPNARLDSLNQLVDRQLNVVKQMIGEGHYADALLRLAELGEDVSGFDKHQEARWHTQRAQCYWHVGEPTHAAREFARAYELTPDDEKIAGNAVRGLMLADRLDEASILSQQLKARFPASASVLTAWLNVRHRAGEVVKWANVPPEFRDLADMHYVFGWFAVLDGHLDAAVEHAERACAVETGDFNYHALLLLALVNKATQNGVLASVGVIPSALRDKVAAVISFFEPLEERLWKHQDESTVCDAVSCLGYAYLLTDQPKKASEVLIDAVGRFPKNGQLHRIALDAIMRANGEDAAFEFGRANVERMDTTGALIVAELSGQRGEYQTVESVRKALGAQALEHEAELRAFRILAYANAGKFSEIKEELTDEELAAESSVALLAIAAAVLHREDRGSAECIVDRLLERIDSNSTLPEALAVAQVCRMLERHDDVVRLLESRLPTGYFSELHSRLFDALVQSGARRKALNMLQSFPVEAMSDGAVRSLAIELAQAANDWTELSRLSDLQLAAYPDRADAWVFRAVVYLRQRRFAELSRMLEREISLELKGGTQVQAQLSRFEIEFGPRERGFARLYRMFRLQPDNPEAASTYFGFIASLPEDQLPIAPPNVTPGSEVQLVDDHGTILTVVIDPAQLSDMPSLQTFKSADGPVASALLGRASGDDVGIHDALGGVHNYRITRITSAFRTLAARARDLIPPMSVGAKGMVSLEVPTDADGHPDVSNLLAMLRERRQKVNETFAFYGQSPMTLGMLARLVGASTADLVSDWPRKDAPPLFVCQGSDEELISAYELLQSGKGYVTDLATIQEMVLNDVEQALQICQPLYIAASAVETLADLKSMTEHDRSVGVAHEHDGYIVMTEASAEQRHLRQSHLNRLSETIERYCIVLPAYGTEEIPVNLARVRDTLDSDSLDAILLALEQSANLLTIDGKLRLLGAAAAELRGLCPRTQSLTVC